MSKLSITGEKLLWQSVKNAFYVIINLSIKNYNDNMIKEAPPINFAPPAETTKKVTEKENDEKNKSDLIPENLAYVLGDLRFLKNREEFTKSPEEYKRRSMEAFKDLHDFIISSGGREIKDINEIYRKYQNNNSEPLIVRREDPEKIALLLNDKDIDLGFDPKAAGDKEGKYANCAVWPYGSNPVAGIKNAFLEGRGMAGPLVSLMAAKQNAEHNTVEILENEMKKIGEINREAVRSASGKISRDDLEFIILRMQKDFFPNESLNDSEKNPEVKQIFRAFSFGKEIKE